jgi:hypothetical protein
MINGNPIKLPIRRILLVQIFIYVTIIPPPVLRSSPWYIHICACAYMYVFCARYPCIELLIFLLCYGITSKSNASIVIVLYRNTFCLFVKKWRWCWVFLASSMKQWHLTLQYQTRRHFWQYVFFNYYYFYVYFYCFSIEIVMDCLFRLILCLY